MKRFEQQVAVISGGAEGLGKGIAYRIASEGGIVILLDINGSKLETTVNEFAANGLQAKGYQTDISKEKDVQELFAALVKTYGKIDIMVNAAGVVGATSTSIVNYPVEEFDRVYQINLRGSFLMTKYAVAAMLPANYGRILLIASIAGKDGNPNMAGYTATKAGVIGLVKGVGKEYATTGITVNGIAPAVIRTAMNDQTDPKQLEYMIAKIPMNRLGTIDEMASLCSWIVSKEASFTTGFVFDLSGGRATY